MTDMFIKRLRAFSIDISGVFIVILLCMGLPFDADTKRIVAGIGGACVYFIPYLFSSGQTFGKRMQKLKVVKADGTKINMGIGLLRELFKLILCFGTIGLYSIVTYFIISEDMDKRTLHDIVFKTRIIDCSKYREYKDEFLNKPESARKRGL